MVVRHDDSLSLQLLMLLDYLTRFQRNRFVFTRSIISSPHQECSIPLTEYFSFVKRPYLVFAASPEAIFPTIKTVIADAGHHGPDKNVREAAGSAAQGNIKIKVPTPFSLGIHTKV